MLYNNINMIEIKASNIKGAGIGVFATEDIDKGIKTSLDYNFYVSLFYIMLK